MAMSLTDEDKKWLLKTFTTKEDLERFATKEDVERFATKEDLGRFATKEDLDRFATKEDLERFATKEDLERFATKEDLERVETRLLTEFHKWASPMDSRVRSHTAVIQALDQELEYWKQRVEKLERKSGPEAA